MGDTVSEYTEVETIIGDVQPHTLTQEMKLYGISESKGNVKLFLQRTSRKRKDWSKGKSAIELYPK